ncbi:heterokaryon incompatibility protein-domain-containing protein [Hypoxylon cercidicola]|nr:heterokaryon incompatibility protein-domain-containing protein [Hypoxylon cercidicola]
MSSTSEEIDDMQSSLGSLGTSSSRSKITAQLEEIQRTRMKQEKSRKFLERLECLYFPNQTDKILSREKLDAYQESNYLALSYTWEPSPSETDRRKGGYSVQRMGSDLQGPSPVRDIVFTRVRKYMERNCVKYLWIDQHCIKQKVKAKEIGMNAMDRVYSLSKHSVALLSRPIESPIELNLLTRVLEGELVREDGNGFWLSQNTSHEEALSVIQLLSDITSDMWFTRGWTFQENYKAGKRMKLLIPHLPTLNGLKQPGVMGDVNGELCIDSWDFHEEVTKFCLAYQSYQLPQASLCDNILSRAGKYTILLQYESKHGDNVAPQSMSPRIIADLVTRNLKNRWDRLPIVANCCQYSVRLDSSQLRTQGHSLAMSMLALCLLNGEILSNHPDKNINVSEARAMHVVDYLKKHFFDELQSPHADKGLTYNKGCRFVDVKLTEKGTCTRGHLWKYDKLIWTTGFRRTPRRRNSMRSIKGLRRWEIGRLEQLAEKLYIQGDGKIANRLEAFIARYSRRRQSPTFSEMWMVQMASILADAIDKGKTLCTAYIFGSTNPGYAIFIVDPRFKDRKYVFTSIRSRREDSRWSDFNDIDKHVFLDVDLANPEGMGQDKWLPELFTKRWVVGLCFFRKIPLQDVVFPWPMSLQGL